MKQFGLVLIWVFDERERRRVRRLEREKEERKKAEKAEKRRGEAKKPKRKNGEDESSLHTVRRVMVAAAPRSGSVIRIRFSFCLFILFADFYFSLDFLKKFWASFWIYTWMPHVMMLRGAKEKIIMKLIFF